MGFPRRSLLVLLASAALPLLAVAARSGDPLSDFADGKPDFNRDVRPVLARYCFECHGPDVSSREADLRLDIAAGATRDLGGYAAIVPGDVEASELVYRLRSDDREERMPPKEVGREPSEEEIRILESWIAGGAEYDRHWAFETPVRSVLPAVEKSDAVRTPVDAFILARLNDAGMDFAPEANRRTLLRRAALDLTGLPPEPSLLASYLADDAPGAWGRAVDALLASPRYGERMASDWLDLARYADTNGYHIDNERTMWPWRDGLIAAWNANQGFDQFTIESLAGDLLPEPSRAQLVASGFHRNHMINFEGGAIAAEYRNEYVVDRVNTTSKVWLGLTMGCAQCHDHKYDPLPQEEYYRMYAYFNTISEKGLDGQNGNADPKIAVPTPEQELRLADLDAQIASFEAELAAPDAEALAALESWVKAQRGLLADEWAQPAPTQTSSDHPTTSFTWENGVLTAQGEPGLVEDYVLEFAGPEQDWRVLRIEPLPGADDAEYPRAGRAENGNFVLSEVELEVVRDGVAERVPLAGAYADHAQPDYPAAFTIDGKLDTGWAADAHNRREARVIDLLAAQSFGAGADSVRVHLRFRYGTAHSFSRTRLSFSGADRPVAALEPLNYGDWSFAAGKEDEIAEWTPRPDFVDGKVHKFDPVKTTYFLMREIDAPAATTRSWSLGSDDGIKVHLNGKTLLDNPVARGVAADQERIDAPLQEGKNTLLLEVDNFGGDAGFYFREVDVKPEFSGPMLEALRADDAAAPRVRDHFLSRHWAPWAERMAAIDDVRKEQESVRAMIPTVMVMREMMEPRLTHLLRRGDYDKLGQEVQAAVPAALHYADEATAEPTDRLALARWLVDPRQPLTARVQVNRLWAMLFGRGLVGTAEDFGAQGDWPTHPELLDWLAVEYMESGWDTKALLRLITTSTVYRQSSRITPEQLAVDPDNQLWSRTPRIRLTGEAIRDQALAASGLLVERLGGPSVRPYQPEGLWREVAYGGGNAGRTASVFELGSGDELYRRSMYTFRKRSSPPPQLATFDAPNREFCVVSRSRTNTPLQALVLLNDPTYLEAARILAAKVIEAEPGTRQRVDRIYEAVLCRPATDREAAILLEAVADRYVHYAAAPEEAAELLSVGMAATTETLDPAEHAAWSCATTLVLNLDETITRG